MSDSAELYEALARYAESGAARFHMPGHKGRAPQSDSFGLLARVCAIDDTEIGPTGDLFGGGELTESMCSRVERAFGWSHAFAMTGGSTLGVFAMLSLCCPVGSRVVCDRNSHRSVHNAMAALDLRPVWLEPESSEEYGVTTGFSLAQLDEALSRGSAAAVVITSPTYYGAILPVEEISKICRAHGALLAVDSAHGAHLGFLPGYRDAIGAGADAACFSLHKTLPAMTGAAAVASGGRFTRDELRRAASVFGSSSPSYPVMASIDLAASDILATGGTEYAAFAEKAAAFRSGIPYRSPSGNAFDPLRLTLCVDNGGGFAERLEKLGIFAEMSDESHAVFILTPGDGLERLGDALRGLYPEFPSAENKFISPPHIPLQTLTPREAAFARHTETVPLRDCAGRVAAECVSPYPPGVPVVSPGEVIGPEQIAFCASRGMSQDRLTRVIS